MWRLGPNTIKLHCGPHRSRTVWNFGHCVPNKLICGSATCGLYSQRMECELTSFAGSNSLSNASYQLTAVAHWQLCGTKYMHAQCQLEIIHARHTKGSCSKCFYAHEQHDHQYILCGTQNQSLSWHGESGGNRAHHGMMQQQQVHTQGRHQCPCHALCIQDSTGLRIQWPP